MDPEKTKPSDDAVIEMIENMDDEDLVEVLLKRNGSVDDAVIQKDVTERIAHAGSVQAAYDRAYAQAEEAMEDCLAQVERLATKYEATFTVLDLLEDRLADEPEPKPDEEGEEDKKPAPDLN